MELYRRLPYCDELEPVREFLHHGATVLELGCGTGRLTRTLVAWGLLPTAVDKSQEMLAHLPAGIPAVWAFSAAPLSESQIESHLSAHGFADTSWHGSNRRWAAAAFEGSVGVAT